MTRTPIEQLKGSIIELVDHEKPELRRLALKIHGNPEVGLHEFKAAGWLTEYLAKNGFRIEKGICDLPTAFRATCGRGGPAIGLLAEYDALPGVGHGCGHNLICTIAVGAAVAAKQTVAQCGGKIIVVGTPAEEGLGGKIGMAQKGAFNDLDAAILVHPETMDRGTSNALACQNLTVEFFGKSTHAAASPERGINALEAMILAFNGINSLRQHIRSTSRIHGIITDGGQAPNVVPEHSAASFIVRATEDAYLDELEQKVVNCFIGAATATGCRMEYALDEFRYAAMRINRALAQLYADNMQTLGRKVTIPKQGAGAGSTDMGNVSQLVPAIHAYVAIAPRGVSLHSAEFAQAAASEDGIKGMCDAAKAVAMTVTDLLADSGTLDRVKEDFRQTQ